MSVLIFTEALATTGLGHLTRCTALAEILQAYGHDVLLVLDSDGTATVSKDSPPILECHWKVPENLMALLNEQKPTLCFVDSYLADFAVYEKIQSHCKRLICIDDDKRIDYPKGSTILNPSLAGKELDYDTLNHEILTGIEYVLLRAPFREDFTPKPIAEKISSILVTVGGEDRWNIVPQITEFLSKEYADCEKYIIVGPAFNNLAEIEKVCDAKTKILKNLSAIEMRDLMLKVDVAITGGGQTTYELVRCGVPMIVLKIAENQSGNIHGLIDLKLIKSFCSTVHNNVVAFVASEMNRLTGSLEKSRARIPDPQTFGSGSGYRNL